MSLYIVDPTEGDDVENFVIAPIDTIVSTLKDQNKDMETFLQMEKTMRGTLKGEKSEPRVEGNNGFQGSVMKRKDGAVINTNHHMMVQGDSSALKQLD